jgi:hypothetical protein
MRKTGVCIPVRVIRASIAPLPSLSGGFTMTHCTQTEMPTPFSPMPDLLESLRALEALQNKGPVELASLRQVRGYLAERKRHPLSSDPA